MAKIHPSAFVDTQAVLAHNVQVGPGCVIEGPVTIGSGCHLIGHVYLHGAVNLGQNNTLYPFTCIGFDPQHRQESASGAGVSIGNGNVFRESVTIHASSRPDCPTTVGDENYLMTNAHLGHDVTVGNGCTLASGGLVGGHGVLGDHVFLGGNGAVHQFCRMGRLGFLGGLSAVTKDVPPFAMAAGVYNNITGPNVVGMRRQGIPRAAIDRVAAAFTTLYLSRHSNPVAAQLIEQEAATGGPGASLLTELVHFIRTSKRGLCPHASIAKHHRVR